MRRFGYNKNLRCAPDNLSGLVGHAAICLTLFIQPNLASDLDTFEHNTVPGPRVALRREYRKAWNFVKKHCSFMPQELSLSFLTVSRVRCRFSRFESGAAYDRQRRVFSEPGVMCRSPTHPEDGTARSGHTLCVRTETAKSDTRIGGAPLHD